MKKDPTRDYTTAMFRRYAAAGCPTYEEAVRKIYERELRRHAGIDPAVAQAKAQQEVDRRAAYLLDIMAVDSTMKTLETGKRPEVATAVRAVYFPDATTPLQRRAIDDRVNRFAATYHADPRTIYRWLREARLLCAAFRGLEIENCQ